MYPVLKIMHILNFLDTFSVGVTTFNGQINISLMCVNCCQIKIFLLH